ncbi:hypothetical protein [Sulfurimonas sp. HSL3-7]|uniref:hypothetical protein n=1 Tax=Sulfonitrofixus jiaomeiensis TaxID=3131938 RepID=UPI0031F7E02B
MPKLAQYKERLLNEFEQRTDEWTYGHFENRLSEIRKNTSYHDAKGIISTAHALGKWPNTVRRYILTNYRSFGNVSSELSNVLNDVYSTLSPQDKKYWGIE